jgi:hypothetical protein
MAITLAEQNILAQNADFITCVRQASATVALEVLDEVQGVMEYDEMIARNNLARRVINDAPAAARRAAYVLATASPTTDPTAITDAQYLTFVRDNWSALAGHNENIPEPPA